MPQWTVNIAGTNYPWKKIHFIKEHPTPDPDTYEVTLKGRVTTINYSDYVVIRRNGVIKFFGYVENIDDSDEGGPDDTIISGRNRKLILWKKYMERFSDTRLEGFFGHVYPHELFAFLLRCPVSDVPDIDGGQDWVVDYPRQKIGWGIASERWRCTAYGGIPVAIDDDFHVDALTNVHLDFSEYGSDPYLHDDDDTNFIEHDADPAVEGEYDEYYTFENLSAIYYYITTTVLNLHCKAKLVAGGGGNADSVELKFELWNGSSWVNAGTLLFDSTSYVDKTLDVSGILTDIDMINGARVRITLYDVVNGGATKGQIRVTWSYLEIEGTARYDGTIYAAGSDPSYPRLRLAGFYWRNRGTLSVLAQYAVNSNVATGTWGVVGAAPWLDTDDGDTSYTYASIIGRVSDEFGFPNLPASTGINNCVLHVKIRKTGFVLFPLYRVTLEINTGSGWIVDGVFEGNNRVYEDLSVDLTPNVHTVDKFNALKIRFTLEASGDFPLFPSEVRITYAYVVMNYKTGGSQWVNDRFIVDLAETRTRVCGIIVQSRYSTDQYPRHYTVDTSLDGVTWTTKASSPVGGNIAQDIIHSWTPCSARYVRVRLNGAEDTTHAWEITQVYIYESDDIDFTILESTTSPNVVLDGWNDIDVTLTPIEPINMAYQRLTDGLEQLVMAAFDASYDPIEWWVDDDEFGHVHLGTRRGSDKSASVKFLRGSEIDASTYKRSIKKSAQRVRVVGKGEGRSQDEVTSNWQEDNTTIGVINSFYEELISEKELSSTTTANEWAKMWLRKLRNIGEEIRIKVTADPYNPPAETYDVGDDVTIKDDVTGIVEDSYRIRQIEANIDEGGEIIYIVVTNSWEVLADRISKMYKELKRMQFSSTGIEEWTAEGSNQGKMNQDKMDNYWSMQRKYDETGQLTKAEVSETYWSNPTNRNDVNVGLMLCNEQWLLFWGPSANTGGVVNPEIYLGDTGTGAMTSATAWDRDPKFQCKVKITEAFPSVNDNVFFGMAGLDAGGLKYINMFGFYIEWDGASHIIKAFVSDAGTGGVYTRNLGTITTGILYELTAEVDWDDRLIFFSVGHPDDELITQGCIPFSGDVVNTLLTPMWIWGQLTGTGGGPRAKLDFYLWKSQGKKESVA